MTYPRMNTCLYGMAQLKTQDYILYNYVQYNRVVSNILANIIGFLQGNLDAFCFQDNIVVKHSA